jgi:penicillin-insensitive murein endopeptidase
VSTGSALAALVLALAAAPAENRPAAGAPDAGARSRDAGRPPGDAGTAAAPAGRDQRWSRMHTPAPGGPRAIGSTSNGCLQGAAALPPSGPGFEVLHLKRERRFGHPLLVEYVRRLAAAMKKERLGQLLVGDLAMPRGGPTLTGHRSHQSGLDADLGYANPPWVGHRKITPAERETIFPLPVIDLKTHAFTKAWTPAVVKVLELAASDPAVDRIFVNPAIKRELCRTKAAAPWLRQLRPWWAHHDHFHVRLRCPAGEIDCQPQDPLPAGNGCEGVAWWFSEDARKTQQEKAEAQAAEARQPPPMPAPCEALLTPERPLQAEGQKAGSGARRMAPSTDQ